MEGIRGIRQWGCPCGQPRIPAESGKISAGNGNVEGDPHHREGIVWTLGHRACALVRMDANGIGLWLRMLWRWAPSPRRQVILLAVPVGIVAGLIGCAYRAVLEWHTAFLDVVHEPTALGMAAVVGYPTAGGLLIGLLLKAVHRKGVDHGMPAVIRALTLGRPQDLTWHTGAFAGLSLLTIKSGGSVGGEGPMAELGALTGVAMGRGAKLGPGETATLAACGVAAGIAAIFNAPIGGILFALEVVVADVVLGAAGPVVLSAIAGAAISHAVFGRDPMIAPPHPGEIPPDQFPAYLWFVLLGVMAGFVAVGFCRSLVQARRSWPVRLRQSAFGPALAGLAVGLVTLVVPQVRGVGYEAVGEMFAADRFHLMFVVVVFAKIACTAVTLGSGAPGGAFAPSIVVGSALGVSFGTGMVALGASVPGVNPALFVLVGMGAVMAGVFQAPLTALMMIFEISGGEPAVMLPTLAAVAPAALVARAFLGGHIYDQSLIARGFHRERYRSLAHLMARRAGEAAVPFAGRVAPDANLLETLELYSLGEGDALLVADADGRVHGLITIEEIRASLALATTPTVVLAGEMARPMPRALPPQMTLMEALALFDEKGLRVATVLRERGLDPARADSLAGTLTRRELS
jgi:CIC family chloride channel protein